MEAYGYLYIGSEKFKLHNVKHEEFFLHNKKWMSEENNLCEKLEVEDSTYKRVNLSLFLDKTVRFNNLDINCWNFSNDKIEKFFSENEFLLDDVFDNNEYVVVKLITKPVLINKTIVNDIPEKRKPELEFLKGLFA
jgi:hypothetical protein